MPRQECRAKGRTLRGLKDVPWHSLEETSAGLPFKAARSVRTEFSLKSLHANLSLLQSGGLAGWKGVCMGVDLDH